MLPLDGSAIRWLDEKHERTRQMMLARTVLLALMVINFGIVHIVRADSNDIALIRNLEDKLAAAIAARNLDAITEVYVPDESLFVFDVISPRQ
jgi:hypothetical protein